jgi:hypothetical protein
MSNLQEPYGGNNSWQDENPLLRDGTKYAQTAATDQQNYRSWAITALEAIQTAIDVVMAYKQYQTQQEIANQQYDIANRQLAIAEALHAHYMNVYVPEIKNVMGDVSKDWNSNRYKPNYPLHMGRARNDAARKYGDAAKKLNKKFSRYSTGANAELLRITNTGFMREEVGLESVAWRREQYQMWQRDEAMFNRLLEMFKVGRQLQADATQDMALAARIFAAAGEMKSKAYGGWYGALTYATHNLTGHAITGMSLGGLRERQRDALQASYGRVGQTNSVLDKYDQNSTYSGASYMFDKLPDNYIGAE